MDIGRYNKQPTVHPQQGQLNEIINEANHAITAFNVGNNVLTPWLAKDIHMNISKRGGLKACRYHRLGNDGLHLTDKLREKWAEILMKAIVNLSDGSRPPEFTEEAKKSINCIGNSQP